MIINKNYRQTTNMNLAEPNNNNLRDKLSENIANFKDLEIQRDSGK